MHYAEVRSRANHGLDAPAVRVEVHLSNGLPAFTVVGMPETAVRESKDRVRSALLNSHFEFPDRRITVNLAPADLPKGGGGFDLPIALGILCASGQLPKEALMNSEALAELALDGGLRPVAGAVAATMAATASGNRVLLSAESAAHCEAVPEARVVHARDLLSLCAVLRGRAKSPALEAPTLAAPANARDLCELAGQHSARRALEIAAAGGHNLLLTGPPGTGKSLLASCLPGILPAPDANECLVVRALYDLQGAVAPSGRRAFRSPHHSASAAALIGGGALPRPGEASLAHGGVLFLDELPEFSRHSLDMLREPLETGEICLARARARIRYPARFQLVAAMNPCPCGFAGDSERACRCSAAQRLAYAARVSGPLLDRLDLQVTVGREAAAALFDTSASEGSAAVQERVQRCADLQRERQGVANAQLSGAALLSACNLGVGERQLVERASERMQLSARAVHRSLRVARSIADLAGDSRVSQAALREALGYRQTVTADHQAALP